MHRLTPLFFVLALLFFLVGNPWLPVTDPVESNYALTAKEMVLSGDWLSPQIYGQYWFDKPIMVYWLLALSYKIFGFTDWAARMPSGLFGALSVAMLYQVLRTGTKRRLFSMAAAIIMGTSLLFWPLAHGIVTDMILLFTTIGTFAYAYRALVEDSRVAIVWAYVFAGLGVLTKGPVALVLPGILLLAFAAYSKSWPMFKRLFAWQGLLAFFLVVGPWYIYMYLTHGMDFINGFLGLNNVTRATESEHPEDNHWWYYLVLSLGAMMPWTGLFLYGLYKGLQKRTQGYMYCLIWGLGTLVFYSLMATKYPTYTFISMIPFSIITAMGLVKAFQPASSKYLEWWLIGPTLLLWAAYCVGSRFVAWGFWYPLYIALAVFTLALIHFHLSRKRYLVPVTVAVGTMVLSSFVITEGLVPLIHQRSSTAVLELVKASDKNLYYYNAYATSIPYYTGKGLTKVNGPDDGSRSQAWEGKYRMPQVSEEALAERLLKGEPVLVLVSKGQEKFFVNSPIGDFLVPVKKLEKITVYTNK